MRGFSIGRVEGFHVGQLGGCPTRGASIGRVGGSPIVSLQGQSALERFSP